MWTTVSIVDQDGKVTEVPLNMDNVITFAALEDPAYPKAKAVIYPSGGFFQSLPVTQTVEELQRQIK